MRKCVLFLTLVAMFTMACNTVDDSAPPHNEEKGDADNVVEMIKDIEFRQGYGLRGTDNSNPDVIEDLVTLDETPSPEWLLSQWGSKYNLEGTAPHHEEDGRVIYENEGKTVTLTPGDAGATVKLEVWASNEYEQPREDGEFWPHLLLEQQFRDDHLNLSEFESIDFQIEGRLTTHEKRMEPSEYNSDLHTAQYSVYFLVQDLNQDSEGFSDFLWFGLPLFDSRYEFIDAYAAPDFADTSAKFIYSVAGDRIYEGSFHDQEWITVQTDILPLLEEAIDMAQEKGYLQDSSFADMTIAEMNIGWEVTGTFDAGLEFKEMRMQGSQVSND